MRRAIWALVLGLWTAGSLSAVPVYAQNVVGGVLRSLDQERLFVSSLFGQRVQRDVEAASGALETENRRILLELSAREAELTAARPNLAADEFRALADEFDAQVETIRTEQEQKLRDLNQFRDQEQQRFFTAAWPILAELLQETGGQALVDARSILIMMAGTDMTDAALGRVDSILGSGVAVEGVLGSDQNSPDNMVTDSSAIPAPDGSELNLPVTDPAQ
jgi:Skp family chaperone for outer membrane proteins